MGHQTLSIQLRLNLYISRDLNYVHDNRKKWQKEIYFLTSDTFEFCVV